MNSVKNLLLVAALAAAGYVVYQSLARNNADPGQPPPGVAQAWPTPPKVDLPSEKPSPMPGGPLPLGASPAPLAAPGLGSGVAALPSPSAPAPTSIPAPTMDPPSAVPAMPPVTPYPSSTPAAASSPIAGANSSPLPPSNPTATLGPPVSPEAISAMPPSNLAGSPSQAPPSDMVRNLAPPAPDSSAADALIQSRFAAFMDDVQKTLDQGKLAEAHAALSTLYGNPELPADQAKQITALLDQLAGTVIYSRKHFLEPPYVTQQGDTLDRVAQKYSIPWQLLASINGLTPPAAPGGQSAAKDQPLPAGMELKVVRGPFNAVVQLDKHELTLMVQNRYAGRFPIGVGRDQPKLDGEYTIRDKVLNPTYYGPDGVNIGPNDPKNPLGGAWIGLSDRIGIHGASDPQAIGRDDNRGTICVRQRDLQDLYGILSVGSRVTVVR
jgi:hypothetical protein